MSSNIVNYSGVKGSFTKTREGIMVLSGANTYSGGTNVNGGVLVAASRQALGTGAVTVNSGGHLALGGGVGADISSIALGNNILVTGGRHPFRFRHIEREHHAECRLHSGVHFDHGRSCRG